MAQPDSRFSGSPQFLESLEGRLLLSTTATKTKISVVPGTANLGQLLNATVTVVSATGVGTPRGNIKLFDNGTLIATAPINKRTGSITGSINALDNGTGGNVFYNGTNVFTAKYVGKSAFAASRSHASTVNISMPRLKKEGGGLKVATLLAGSGAAAVTGNNVTVAYTGYVAATGAIFDSTIIEDNAGNNGESTFTLGGGTVAVGFNNGIIGMQAGEVRVLDIPADLAFGDNPPPPSPSGVQIPPNAEIIFVISLVSINS
jgi:FKBP-type peptidyl-prolyl cis-trans isomerase